MYEDMINAPLNQGPNVAFTLLTKVMFLFMCVFCSIIIRLLPYCLSSEYFDSLMYGFGWLLINQPSHKDQP